MDYLDFLTNILRHASDIAKSNMGNIRYWIKDNDNNQVVTKVDNEIGKYIIKEISKSFENHNIIDEEQGIIDKSSEYTWAIDPIDGTSNYVCSVPTYGILVGLLEQGTPIAGGIALPYFSDIYTAQKSKGAFRNNQKIHVSNEDCLANCLVAYGLDGNTENPEDTLEDAKVLAKMASKTRNLRNSNSVYDVALVADGRYAAAVNRSSRVWDNVAQQILIEEAGGVYTDLSGNPVKYNSPLTRVGQNFTFLAASPQIHEELKAIINH